MPFDGIRNSALVRTLADVLEDLPDLLQKEMRLAQAEFTAKIKKRGPSKCVDDGGGAARPHDFFYLDAGRHFRNREPWTSASLVLLDRRRRDWWMRRGSFPLRAFHHAK